MKVFVTGATGFLGSVLVKHLLSDDVQIRAIKRKQSSLDLLGSLADKIEWLEGDVEDIDSLIVGLKGTEGVYHCAAYLGFDGITSLERLNSVNVDGTSNVVNACLEYPGIRMLHVSSIAALGRSDNTVGELNESTEWKNSSLNTAYAISKHRAEMAVFRGVAEGLEAIVVNPSLVMGPGRKGENTMQIAERLKAGSIPFIPTGGTNVVDVEDVALGAIAAFKSGKSGHRYVLSGHNMTWHQIMSHLAEALNVKVPSRSVSPRILTSFACAAEAWATISRSKPLITREAARLSSSLTYYSNEKAKTELGYTSRPFEDTASRIAAALNT